jgi:hypothetical protein
MPRIPYRSVNFRSDTLAIIDRADTICRDYARQGFTLTLRQVYYQFVARGWLANRDTEYKRLGSILNDARLAGLLDWNHMEDRTRNLKAQPHWDTPAAIVDACARQFSRDLWRTQEAHVEVWIEKDALVGVIEPACTRNDVAYFSCRGYTSQSEVWGAAQRLIRAYDAKAAEAEADEPRLVVLHLGDHDPSGIDMTRDIGARLREFLRHEGEDYEDALTIRRLALNMPQVREYEPPPNPAKLSDSRATGYIGRYGDESWELDALDPPVIDALIQDAIDNERDLDLWDEAVAERDRERATLANIARQWGAVENQYGS